MYKVLNHSILLWMVVNQNNVCVFRLLWVIDLLSILLIIYALKLECTTTNCCLASFWWQCIASSCRSNWQWSDLSKSIKWSSWKLCWHHYALGWYHWIHCHSSRLSSRLADICFHGRVFKRASFFSISGAAIKLTIRPKVIQLKEGQRLTVQYVVSVC